MGPKENGGEKVNGEGNGEEGWGSVSSLSSRSDKHDQWCELNGTFMMGVGKRTGELGDEPDLVFQRSVWLRFWRTGACCACRYRRRGVWAEWYKNKPRREAEEKRWAERMYRALKSARTGEVIDARDRFGKVG